MGQGYRITCRHCGHQFERWYGFGFAIAGTIYCNCCGKAKNYKGSDERRTVLNQVCECGGRYEDDARGTCPSCGVVLKDNGVDYEEQKYCMWD